MARIRQIKPQFFLDAGLRKTFSDEELLFYIGLWQQADDAGWLQWDPAQLGVELYPFTDVAQREADIAGWGEHFAQTGRLRILKCCHAHIPSLVRHQRFAGATRRVYTIKADHEANCEDPRGPAVVGGDPRGPALERNVSGIGNRVGGRSAAREYPIESDPPRTTDAVPIASLDAIETLINEKWGWKHLTAGQRELVRALSDQFDVGAKGCARTMGILQTAPRDSDPIDVLKAEAHRLASEGRQRAERDERSAAQRQAEERRAAPALLADVMQRAKENADRAQTPD